MSGRRRISSRGQAGGDTAAPVRAYPVEAGRPHPFGATVDPGGINFSVFCHRATSMELLLFAGPSSTEPFQVIALDPLENRTLRAWHAFVPGLPDGTHYAYRVDGPPAPDRGLRFDPDKVLVDPYARGNTTALWRRGEACGPGSNLATSMRSVAIGGEAYDWEGDRPLARPMSETVIYEMHVGGFTRSPTSGVANPGTFAAVIDKIPYLRSWV